jgi:hypothetical protein
LDHSRYLRPLRTTSHRLAKRTQSAEITRSDPNHRVTISNGNTSTNSPAELRIPLAMFTGPSPPPGVNIAGNLIISQQDLLNLAKFHFVTRNGYV